MFFLFCYVINPYIPILQIPTFITIYQLWQLGDTSLLTGMLLEVDPTNQSTWEVPDLLPTSQVENPSQETVEIVDESSIEARLFLICTHSGTEVCRLFFKDLGFQVILFYLFTMLLASLLLAEDFFFL